MEQRYNPQNDLCVGIRGMEQLEMFPWDDYYARMAQTDFLCGRAQERAVKTYFVRSAPFNGSYMILGGLTAFLRQLDEYRFTEEVCRGLKEQGFREEWIEFVKKRRRLRLKVYANHEGSIFLGNEPVISIVGDLHDVRLGEGMALRNVNFPSLALTKWNRVVLSAKPSSVIEFGRRRAQDANRTSLYSYLAGCAGTSNSEIRRWFDIPIFGTMGHEWIQSFGDDFSAFDAWLERNPDRPVLLVDTNSTLEVGTPSAIKAFKKHWERIMNIGGKPGIRNDSGDIAYLTLAEAKMLNDAGLPTVRIFQTNELDEYAISSIKSQIAQHCSEFSLDVEHTLGRLVWAAGTKPATSWDQPALGGVQKLMELSGFSCIKISDHPAKTSIPGFNHSAFIWQGDDLACCLLYPARLYEVRNEQLFRNGERVKTLIAIHPDDASKQLVIDSYRAEARQHLFYSTVVTEAGVLSYFPSESRGLKSVREYIEAEISRLHWSHRRLTKPHIIKLSLAPELFELRQKMIQARVLRSDFLQ